MSSIIDGFNYDIFISYRQKDNKHDGWVTEFVDNLKGELESTFKEEISVYFDINPHDGLLETHDVDASLKDKLKCLVFIPIISRTYCDPKSFAWEHEFKAFVEQASLDQFGLKVKLPNGNVANRVLPVRIHDLDAADIKECESVLGGVLRGIEFIYKEPGIDKPLASGDNEKKNLNNTTYRIQIIKMVHAIKEIIQGIKAEPVEVVKEKAQPKESIKEVKEDERRIDSEKPSKVVKSKLLFTLAFIAILIVAGILLYPKIFKRNTLEKLRSTGEKISVAVMPFQNMTNDTTWNVWQDGIQNELITSLTNSEELKVRQTGSINNLIQSKGLTNYASITPSVASNISQKLDANVFIYGSIKEVGNTIRINAQLIDSKTQDAFKSFQIDGTTEKILHIIDSLSVMVKNSLLISKLERAASPYISHLASTNFPEAYRWYINGSNAFRKMDFFTAIKSCSQAITIDSNFTSAAILNSLAYFHMGMYDQAKKWCLRVYEKRDQMPMCQQINTNWAHAIFFETPFEEIKYLKQLLEIDDQWPNNYLNLGVAYIQLNQSDKAIPELEKALNIYDKWDSKPPWAINYFVLEYAYHETGNYKKEKKLFGKAEQDFPDSPPLICRHAILSLTEGDTIEANRYIEKYKFISKENSSSEADIATTLAGIYSEGGIMDKAEEYYRQALSLDPKTLVRMNNLAYFLIDKDRNINGGMKLVDKALELSPDSWYMLDTKGWGFYKQGKYKEALDALQKADSLRPIYDHEIYLHLEAAKKAVASQKNN
jgi:tetratricopeptide (TPR) repeat protein